MCHRKVPYSSFTCGHSYPSGEGELIDCQKKTCRLSTAHPNGPRQLCGPNCGKTCIGARMPPEGYIAEAKSEPCYKCPED